LPSVSIVTVPVAESALQDFTPGSLLTCSSIDFSQAPQVMPATFKVVPAVVVVAVDVGKAVAAFAVVGAVVDF
jgi:hypothetical protein